MEALIRDFLHGAGGLPFLLKWLLACLIVGAFLSGLVFILGSIKRGGMKCDFCEEHEQDARTKVGVGDSGYNMLPKRHLDRYGGCRGMR